MRDHFVVQEIEHAHDAGLAGRGKAVALHPAEPDVCAPSAIALTTSLPR